ncbi:MAG: NAD(P)H-dependent oxidoreductase [Rubrivivax sp.]|jgi:putative NADPH-quinone reductase|nr:NAD(P)H-dependent oxidoreductase [Rubrivivax sp.]
MRLLLVFCHPDPDSFGAALRRAAADALRGAGHELREIDLYAEGFDPVFSRDEKRSYLDDTARNVAGVAAHVDALRWAEGWVVVYPTWFYGVPAMLKGWLDRVWLPGVAFRVASAKQRRIGGELDNIRLFVGITTSGSPWWWLKVIGDPGRSLFMKGLRPLYARRCAMRWLQLYDMNHVTQGEREAFVARVRRELAALPLR